MNRGSSRRLIGAPRTSSIVSVVMAPLLRVRRRGSGRDRGGGGSRGGGGGRADARRGAGLHRRRSLADGGHDVVVTGAPTEVALERVPDLAIGRLRVPIEQVGGRHDHARGAEAALEA